MNDFKLISFDVISLFAKVPCRFKIDFNKNFLAIVIWINKKTKFRQDEKKRKVSSFYLFKIDFILKPIYDQNEVNTNIYK